MRWLKRIVIGTVSVVVVLVALALIVPFLIPTSTYKDQIQSRVKAATGRDLILGGDLKFSILPSLELSARDVRFANAPGSSQKEMATLKSLDLKLKLGPLISGRFEIDALVLQEPTIVLEVDKQGKPNWQFDKATAAVPANPAAPSDKAKPGDAATRPAPLPTDIFDTLQIAELRIVRGNVVYADARTGQRYELAKANLDLSLPGGDRPFRIVGDVDYKGKQVKFRSEVKSPIDFMKGQATAIVFEFGLDLAKITLNGTAQGGAAPKFAGPLKVEIGSVRDLAAWAGSPLPAGKTFGPFNISANVNASQAAVNLTALSVKFDDIAATGELAVVQGAVPTLRGSLVIPALNVNPYMAAGPAAAPAQPGTPAARPSAPPPAGPAAAPATINPAPLRALNADLKLDIRKIEAKQFKVEQATVAIKLAAGVLAVTLEPVLLYGGQATGTITVNGARTPITVAPNIQLKGLNGNALLVALGAGDSLTGTLNASANLTGTGSDAKAIQNSLAGTASFQFANGALKGYNLAGMFRALGDVKNPLEIIQQVKKAVEALNRYDGSQRTDFSELSASFRAANGVFNTNDLRMAAPLIRVEGRGNISVAASALDMLLLVRAVPTLQGQGSEFAKLGIPIPLRVHGPFANVSYGLDEKALGDELRKKLPDMIKDQILNKPGDLIKRPSGILDQFRR